MLVDVVGKINSRRELLLLLLLITWVFEIQVHFVVEVVIDFSVGDANSTALSRSSKVALGC